MNNSELSLLERLKLLIEKDPNADEVSRTIKKMENSPAYLIPYEAIGTHIKNCTNIINQISYAKYLLRINQKEKSLKLFEKILKTSPDNIISWYYIIKIYSSIGAKKKAESKIKEALLKSKRHPSISTLKNQSEKNNKLIHECIAFNEPSKLANLIKITHNKNRPEENAYILFAKAKLEHLKNNNKSALNYIFNAIEIIPTEYRFWTLASRISHYNDDIEVAYNAAIEATTLDLNNTTLNTLLITSSKLNTYFIFDQLIESYLIKKPNDTTALKTKSQRYRLANNEKLAIQTLKKAYDIDSKNTEIVKELALTTYQAQDYESSINFFNILKKLANQKPFDIDTNLYYLVNASLLNDWNLVDELLPQCLNHIDEINQISSITAAFHTLSLTDSVDIHLALAKKTAKTKLSDKPIELTERGKFYKNHKKIRIGFLSGDIGEHIVSRILLRALEKANKNILETYIYSYRASDESQLYNDIREMTIFTDISTILDRDAALKIQKDEIDILIDLTLYTSNSRSNIMSYRPAPIQLHHIGYPSTSGSYTTYDFTILDSYLISESTKSKFTELIISRSRKNKIYSPELKSNMDIYKENAGLPKDKFILASFNEPYKITRHMFELWCDILKNNTNTILLMYVRNESQKVNISKFIKEKKISSERVIFAPRVNYEEHKARIKASDLILDTFPYGNHSSALSALKLGTPIISYRGESVASRYSSMYLSRAGLDELICDTDESFINTASKYINDITFRNRCLHKLASNENCYSSEQTQIFTNFDIYETIYERFKSLPYHIAKQNFTIP